MEVWYVFRHLILDIYIFYIKYWERTLQKSNSNSVSLFIHYNFLYAGCLGCVYSINIDTSEIIWSLNVSQRG